MTMIKVASYNIHKAVGTDRMRNPERIIDVLNSLDADVIALQEADRRFGARLAAIPSRLLELHSDYQAVPLDVQADSMGWHGNAMLVRRSIRVLAHDIIHLPYLEPRGAIMAEIEIGGRPLRLYGMHLDLSGLWRRRQAAAVIHAANSRPEMPTLLMGDLNEWSANRGCLADFGRHFAMAPCGRSFHARRQVASLDRIMWRGPLALAGCGVHATTLARRASDHLPVWAAFTASS